MSALSHSTNASTLTGPNSVLVVANAELRCLVQMVLQGVGRREQKEEGLGQNAATSRVGFERTW